MRGQRRLRRLVGALLLAAASFGGGAAPDAARAEEQPAILKAYGLDWIERVREEAWPQPKAQRPVICLLDTGVNITPDTPADDPNGPIVARLALDGGTGVAQGQEWQHEHGTQMAAIMAAPRNGYGTVGVFPQARIVSIRVTDGAETFITPAAVELGVRACIQYAHVRRLRAAAVAIPESSYDQRTVDLPLWKAAGMLAGVEGAVLVLAAGNGPGDAPVAPFAVPDALVVAAGNEAGQACPFVAELDQAAALRGPGCFPSRSWPAGSSAATVSVAALVAAIVSWKPEITNMEALSLVRDASSRASDGRKRLDATAIGGLFPAASGVTPGVEVTKAPITATPPPRQLLWRPKIRATWTHGRLHVRRLDRHRRGRLVVEIRARGGGRVTREAKRVAASLRFRTAKPGVVRVWIVSPERSRWRSLSVRSAVR